MGNKSGKPRLLYFSDHEERNTTGKLEWKWWSWDNYITREQSAIFQSELQGAVENTPRALSKVWTAQFVKKLAEAGDCPWEELHSLKACCFCQLFLGTLPAGQRSHGRDGLYLGRYHALLCREQFVNWYCPFLKSEIPSCLFTELSEKEIGVDDSVLFTSSRFTLQIWSPADARRTSVGISVWKDKMDNREIQAFP